jgi:excisionase family DNA binding protein
MLVGDLVSTREAAELLRVSPWTISAWLSQGKLRRVKAGGRTLIAKADLEAFVRRSSNETIRIVRGERDTAKKLGRTPCPNSQSTEKGHIRWQING